jgi:hypothetical protein
VETFKRVGKARRVDILNKALTELCHRFEVQLRQRHRRNTEEGVLHCPAAGDGGGHSAAASAFALTVTAEQDLIRSFLEQYESGAQASATVDDGPEAADTATLQTPERSIETGSTLSPYRKVREGRANAVTGMVSKQDSHMAASERGATVLGELWQPADDPMRIEAFLSDYDIGKLRCTNSRGRNAFDAIFNRRLLYEANMSYEATIRERRNLLGGGYSDWWTGSESDLE